MSNPRIINHKDLSSADVVLLGAPYERTVSFGPGAAKGPEAILSALESQVELYERFTETIPADVCKTASTVLGDLQHRAPEQMVAIVEREYGKLLDTGAFVVLLGGEHTVTTGALRALASRQDARQITVCQIDAHLDLRHDDSDYSDAPHGQYAHSTVMRRALELGYQTVHIGARAYSLEELRFARDNRLPVFEWRGEPVASPDDILKAVRTEQVYLTIDVDGFDPSFMPATGTPVQGGLEWFYAMRLFRRIFEKRAVVGVDIVEVAPRSGDTLTEYGAAQLCYTLIAYRNCYGKRNR
jgi:agmatinase